jgi:hypothetical protein
VQRIVVVSIIGTDRFTAGYGAAKAAHEKATLAGPIAAQVLHAAQFHEFVAQLVEWGTQGEAAYPHGCARNWWQPEPSPRYWPTWRPNQPRPGNGSRRSPAPGKPREESLVGMSTLLISRCGGPSVVEGVSDPDDPDGDLNENGALLPGPGAIIAGPTFAEWLDSAS